MIYSPLGLPHSQRDSMSLFVGRQREPAHLWRHYESALDGNARVVVVSGEPGGGKTRLVSHFALLDDLRWAYGASLGLLCHVVRHQSSARLLSHHWGYVLKGGSAPGIATAKK